MCVETVLRRIVIGERKKPDRTVKRDGTRKDKSKRKILEAKSLEWERKRGTGKGI